MRVQVDFPAKGLAAGTTNALDHVDSLLFYKILTHVSWHLSQLWLVSPLPGTYQLLPSHAGGVLPLLQ